MIDRPEWYSEEEWQEAKSNAAKEPRPAEGNARKARGNGAGAAKEKDEKRTPQANKLIALSAEAKLFHTADGNCYADFDINGHRETWPVRSKGFRRWLTRRYFEEEDGAANDAAVSTALGMIEAHAHFNSPERKVHVRVGGMDGKLYLDLCNADWRAIEIDAAGWRVTPLPPVRFRRSAGMQPLPMPLPGGTVGTLKSFLNVKSDEDFVLAVAWILATLRDHGPYPILALAGEHGSAKSSFSSILRLLCDPNTAPLRALPREDRDLFIAASNGHVLSFDNISGLPAWISDTLCRLATGGGFATRTLYSDQDETLFDSSRPIILNGIEDIVTRPDLADRSLFLTLEPISEGDRRPEKELYAAFEKQRPYILGALLTAVSRGLKRLPETRLEKLPRMADFALWATACEGALWAEGAFGAAYSSNLAEATGNVADADPIAAAIRVLMREQTEWSGFTAALLAELAQIAGDRAVRAKDWPNTPKALGGRLRRAAPLLRKLGIDIRFPARTDHKQPRAVVITSSEEGKRSAPSAPSAPQAGTARDNNELGTGPNSPGLGPNPGPEKIGPDIGPAKSLKDKLLAEGADGADEIGGWEETI